MYANSSVLFTNHSYIYIYTNIYCLPITSVNKDYPNYIASESEAHRGGDITKRKTLFTDAEITAADEEKKDERQDDRLRDTKTSKD